MIEEDIRKRSVFNKYLELSAIDAETFFSDKSQFVQVHCPCCDANEAIQLFEKNGFDYTQCKVCDTIYCNPRPSLKQFETFYRDSPSTSFWVNKFFMPVAEERRKRMFKPRAEFMNELLGKDENLVIGDIGAGFGIFLEELAKLRPNDRMIAIEPSLEMASICREKNIEVIEKLIEQVESTSMQFDVLISFELFEHLHTPVEFVRNVFKLIKPGGKLYMTTLNGLGYDIQVLWDKSKSISPPHHLNFANPKSMETLFKEEGFSEVTVDTPGVLDWSIVEGGMQNNEYDPGHFWQTLSKYGSDEAKEEFQKWIANFGFSSHMRIVATR